MQIYICPECERSFTSQGFYAGVGRIPKYCSNACRQLAYRKRHGQGRRPFRKVLEQRLATKRSRLYTATCHQCGLTFEVDGTRRQTRYCSNTCKQRAYRERRRERSSRMT